MKKRNIRFKQILVAAIGCLTIVVSGYAQSLEKGQVEGTGQVGVVADIGTHASLAGSAGVAASEKVFVFGEFSWIPTGGTNTSGTALGGNFAFEASGRLLTLMGGAQYQFQETRSFVPYAAAALGLVHGSQSLTQTIGGITTRTSVSSDHLYVSLGGGARYYVSGRWGFKPEFMIFAGDNTFFRFGGGVFYRFGR